MLEHVISTLIILIPVKLSQKSKLDIVEESQTFKLSFPFFDWNPKSHCIVENSALPFVPLDTKDKSKEK